MHAQRLSVRKSACRYSESTWPIKHLPLSTQAPVPIGDELVTHIDVFGVRIHTGLDANAIGPWLS